MKQYDIILHTGSNMGNRIAHLQQANALIGQRIGIICRRSQYYRTAAWGKTAQPDFVNQALWVKTVHSPHQVLEEINCVEEKLLRKRIEKWGQRTLDVDLVFYEQEIIQTKRLTVPHPLMQHRNFVLVPVCEIAAEWQHPVFKKSVESLLEESGDALKVVAWHF